MKLLSRLFLGKETYLTYPHCNAFADGGQELIYMGVQEGILGLYSRNPALPESLHLCDVGSLSELGGMVWYDVARRDSKVAAIFNNGVWILDRVDPSGWVCVHQPGANVKIDGLCSLAADGGKVLCGEIQGETRRAIEIDLGTGRVLELFSKSWHANHFHYCPHDESWVAFSHEGPAEHITDRCWIWHSHHAPEGRVAFDQASEDPARPLCVGHERWGFHDVSAYVPAYAVSPVDKRGLYEIFGDGRPARLLWENDVLWHCNMDQTGRFVAVDTTGPFREIGLGEEEFWTHREQHLRTDRERGQNASDVMVLDLQTRRALRVATVLRSQHPYHPHPALSPRADWIAWNDAAEPTRGAWMAALEY